ncbi:hypothetical protein F9L33_14425 [Amylibacter sp. SFDW26]|uniref:hypothetical protein n=1 Tax=Amylibacter sp. SFDW26 TaxID=2652722 RepID=UPI001261F60E|nr:hypothetical protein [Amylibacter sp. SFDW26]KAB7610491.1 hypothetical protein F9L33_14425 [Amylibacter sp. SFDW26]
MKKFALIAGVFIVLLGGFITSVIMTGPQDKTLAQEHIAYVMISWNDTPLNGGFLPTAIKEVIVAAAHAQYSKDELGNLAGMQLHATHVRHAIDPALEERGPGLGYGMLKASESVVKHITLASQMHDASDDVKAHTMHVVKATETAMARAKEALRAADAILAAVTAEEANPHAVNMAALTEAAHLGLDVNGDGQITWDNDEGGLKIADQHMGFMLEAEGLKR